MPERTTDELLEEFKAVLNATIEGYEDPVLKFQSDNGMSDWSLNDWEDGMITDGIPRRDIAKVLAHAAIILAHEEARYYADVEEQADEALKLIEEDEEASDEEKRFAAELVSEGASGQLDGFSHCVALVYGWVAAAIAADESDSINWDDMLKGAAENE